MKRIKVSLEAWMRLIEMFSIVASLILLALRSSKPKKLALASQQTLLIQASMDAANAHTEADEADSKKPGSVISQFCSISSYGYRDSLLWKE